MFKNCFVAAAIVLSIPAFASAQDIFWSFSPTEVITTSTVDPSSTTGSVYIFSDGLFGFDALDLNFTTSAPDVLRFTSGEAFNPEYNIISGTRFDRSVVIIDDDENLNRLFSVNVAQNGVNPDIVDLFDPGFVPGVGPNGAVLLARVDYELIGFGEANLEFDLGDLGAFELPNNNLNPSLGSATLSVGLPENAIQDLFWSFSPTEVITTSTADPSSTTGSVYIFSDRLFGFDALDLNFTTSAPDVLRFTGGEAFNPEYNIISGTRFDRSVVIIDDDEDLNRLFLVNVVQNGVNPDIVDLFDPGFIPGVGPNGAVLLARVDYELIGFGEANLEFDLGDLGAFELPNNNLNPSLGSATLSVDLPEYAIGDVNLSGNANLLDIVPFLRVLISGEYQREADCNSDGVVSLRDISPFVTVLTGN